MAESKKLKKFKIRAILIACIALLAVLLVLLDIPEGIHSIVFKNPNIPDDFGKTEALDIAFFDVGQGDSALIGCNGYYILIDTGEMSEGYTILSYLDDLKVKSIDIMVLTHPHTDHIGGACDIIENMDVGIIYMPDAVTSTITFENVLDTASQYDVEIYIPEVGEILDTGFMTLTFMHPEVLDEYENLNNESIVFKAENSFGSALFAGDLESDAESELLLRGFDLSADILKVGHHGSSTSTSDEFLASIMPEYAVISCGQNNDFGHPSDEVTELLDSCGITSFVTYQTGNIYFSLSESGIIYSAENGLS